eukprot:194596-Prorocentrum_minimum.AAC.8
MKDNDVICIVNGSIRNQKDLEIWHGVSSYESVSDFVLALYMKVILSEQHCFGLLQIETGVRLHVAAPRRLA